MISWVLAELEKQPVAEFYQKELEARDAAAFAKLKAEKLLICIQPDEQSESREFGQREPLTVVKIHGKLYGVDEQDPEADLVQLSRADLMKCRFSLERFIQKLAEANDFSGLPEKLHDRLYYAGEREIDDSRVALILAFIDQDKSAENLLLGLPGRLTSGFHQFYVVTPSYSVKSIFLSDKLSQHHVYVTALQDFETFRVDLSVLTNQASILNPQQEKDYERYQYKCRSAIDITGETTPVGNNKVSIGDILVELGDTTFLLFLRLVLQLKRDKWGTASTVSLMDEGYLSDNEHQSVLRLRERFKPLLSMKPSIRPNDFIERLRPKTLRLSVHPDLVTCHAEKLSGHDDSRVRELVQQLVQAAKENSSAPT